MLGCAQERDPSMTAATECRFCCAGLPPIMMSDPPLEIKPSVDHFAGSLASGLGSALATLLP